MEEVNVVNAAVEKATEVAAVAAEKAAGLDIDMKDVAKVAGAFALGFAVGIGGTMLVNKVKNHVESKKAAKEANKAEVTKEVIEPEVVEPETKTEETEEIKEDNQ